MTKNLELRTGELDARYESIVGDVTKSVKAARHQGDCSMIPSLPEHNGIGDNRP